MSTPVRASTSASLSANGRPSRRASALPTAVLPEPIGPIRNTLRLGTVTFGILKGTVPFRIPKGTVPSCAPQVTVPSCTKRNGRPEAAVGLGRSPPRSLDRGTLAQDLGRHEDQ